MFPDWDKTPEKMAQFKNLKKILMQRDGVRAQKNIDDLRVQILQGWSSLSKMFPEPLTTDDLNELGKHVHHRYFTKG